MSRWLIVMIAVIIQQKPLCVFGQGPAYASNEQKATTLQIDQINQQATNIYLSNPAKARGLAEKALLLSNQIKYKHGTGQSLLNIGVTYWAQSYYSISLFYLNTALQYLQKNDQLLLSACYRQIGRDYADLMNYKDALIYLEKARVAAGNDTYSIEESTNELSYVYLRSKQYEKAIATLNQAVKLSKTINRFAHRGILYGRMANIYVQKKDYDKASAYADTALALSISDKNKRLRATIYISKALIMFNLNQPDKALRFARHAELLADSIGVMDLRSNAIKSFIKIYEKSGDINQALIYQKKYNQLQDSLNRVDKQKSAELIKDYFALSTRLKEINEIEAKNEEQHSYIIILSVSLAVVSLALYIVYHWYNQKRILANRLHQQHLASVAQTQLIEVQAQRLEILNKFKDRLLAVIGHDLRSPINNLRNITDMFDEGSFAADDVQLLMAKMKPVLISTEITLGNLLEWAEKQIKGNYIQPACLPLHTIVTEIEGLFAHPLKQKEIAFTCKIEDDCAILADEDHLKVIFRNIMSNAIKYTPPKGKINIGVFKQGNDAVISISDTGSGMNAEETERLFSIKTHFSKPGTQGEKGTGIGLLLCHELVELNNAKMWVQSEPGVGTTFYVSFPVC